MPDLEAPTPAPGPTGSPGPDGGRAPRTAVVVDDHEVVRDFVVTLLQEEGFTVTAAVGTLGEGYDAIIRERPLVAIIDRLMPDGDGADLCARVRQVAPELKLVLHTGALLPMEERRDLASGADAVVLKSVRCVELISTVRRLAEPSL